MAGNTSKTAPIESKDQLIAYMEEGCTPPDQWRIGTEHEKFAYDPDTLMPLDYEGDKGIRRMLEGLSRFGWDPVLENGNPIALSKPDNSSVTLEPGGQIELSGAPLETIHQTCSELGDHLKQVKEIATEMQVGVMGLGYRAKATLDQVPWMPKGRYKIMREYMPKVGSMGLEMMLATCTVQVNLDFSSEERMVRMFRAALALQPVATAMWANSPFKHGEKNGYLSYRSHIWTDTDPDRTGMLPFVFEDGFGFERYVDYMLDVPMYFVYRDGTYIDASGQSFRDFMTGNLPALPGEIPSMKDWEDHMTTTFPEVRLKKFLEMRGADGGPWGHLCALPGYWVGLLYDDDALEAVEELIADWTIDEMQALRRDVPKQALHTSFRDGTVQDLALKTLDIAHEGLRARARMDSSGQDETHFLEPLNKIARSGRSPAEDLIELFDTEWDGKIEHVFDFQSYL